MRNRLFRITIAVAVFTLLLAVIANPVVAGTVLVTMGATGGVLLAVSLQGPATIETTEGSTTTHLKRDISTIITEQKPDDYALDTMVRRVRKEERAIHIKVEYEEVAIRAAETQTNGAFTAAGTAADEHADITVDDASGFDIDDVVRFAGIAATGGEDQRAMIVSKSGNALEFTGLNSTTDQRIPSVADNTKVYKLSNAKTELDAQTQEKYLIPAQDYNYCQTFMCQVGQSELESKTQAYSGYDYNNKRKLEIYQFRSELEANQLLGVRSKITNPLSTTDVHYTQDGVRTKIGLSINFGSGSGAVDPSIADVLDMSETLFANNSGSTERVMFGGSTVINAISKISNYERHIGALEKTLLHGVKVSRLESPFGTVNLVHSKTMSRQGYKTEAVIVDLDHIIKKSLIPMNAIKLELNKSGQKRVVNTVRIDETSCLTIRYAGSDGVHAKWIPTP